MNNNPQTPKLILYDRHEIIVENNKQYMVVYDKTGETHKINEKRQALWRPFINASNNQAFLLIYETYNNTQYVAGVKTIADELLQKGLQDIVSKSTNPQSQERNRSTSLSYSKDMLIADKIDMSDLFTQAEKNYRFIINCEVEQYDDSKIT